MSDTINKNSNKINEIYKFVTDYIGVERSLTSTFPGGRDDLTNAFQKIGQIVVMYTNNIPVESFIPLGILNFGVSDEELRIDTYKGFLYPQARDKIAAHERIEPTWRPAAYTIPATESIEIAMTFSSQDQEFLKVTRNPSELAKFAMAKAVSFDNSLILHENALRIGARKEFIKLILKIYKHAPTFATNTQYKITNQNNVQTYGIDLTYVKNQDGTKVGCVFKQIEAGDGYQTYEEAEAAGKIRTLSLIKKIPKPGSGTTKAKQSETSDNFVTELMVLEDKIINQNLEGACLNASCIGQRSEGIVKIWQTEAIAKLKVNTLASAYNKSDLKTSLLENIIRLPELFTDEEIAADDAGDKLGLKDVYGAFFDFSGPIPLFAVGYDFTAPNNDDGNFTHMSFHNDDLYDRFSMRYIIKPYFKISPNKFCMLIVHTDPQ